MGWLRHYIRKNTTPIQSDTARKWKTIFSSLYFFSVWNLFAFAMWTVIKNTESVERQPEESASQHYAKLLGTKNATVYSFTGLKFDKEYQINETTQADVTTGTTKDKEQENGKINTELQ